MPVTPLFVGTDKTVTEAFNVFGRRIGVGPNRF